MLSYASHTLIARRVVRPIHHFQTADAGTLDRAWRDHLMLDSTTGGTVIYCFVFLIFGHLLFGPYQATTKDLSENKWTKFYHGLNDRLDCCF